MKIHLKKTAERQIGNVRVSPETFHKIEEIAKRGNVSNQSVIRAILEQVIDDIEL